MKLRTLTTVLPVVIWVVGGCVDDGAGAGLFDTTSQTDNGDDTLDTGPPTPIPDGIIDNDTGDFGGGDVQETVLDQTDDDSTDITTPADIDFVDITDTESTDGDGDITTVPEGPGLAGMLVDESQNPLENVKVLACLKKTCYYGESKAAGAFVFQVDPPAEIALKTLGNMTTNPRQGAALVPVVLTDNQLVQCGQVFVPFLPDGAKVGPASQDPQTLNAGDGLTLTLNRADIQMPPGEILADVAATTIPEAQIPPLPTLPKDEILVAMYALHPFSAKSKSPIAVKAPSSLPNGTPVLFRTISSLDGTMSKPVSGTADGQWVSTEVGSGVLELTRIVITTLSSNR